MCFINSVTFFAFELSKTTVSDWCFFLTWALYTMTSTGLSAAVFATHHLWVAGIWNQLSPSYFNNAFSDWLVIRQKLALKAALCRNWHFTWFGTPRSAKWVQITINTKCSSVKVFLDVMLVLSTDKTHWVITVLYVENLYVEVNTYVALWSCPLTEVTKCKNKWRGAKWLRQRHHWPCYNTLSHQHDSEAVILR